MVRVSRPPLLSAIRAHPAGTIEASAGTGKTHLLVHLVVDLVLSGIPIENILVVTFTEKATHELARRLRAKLTELAAVAEHGVQTEHASTPDVLSDGTCWVLDETARARVQRALLCLDGATVSTIHGFCQRILSGSAFLHGLPFEQKRVPARVMFHDVFRDWLRTSLVNLPAARAGIPAWLGLGESIDSLEELLYQAHELSSQGTPLDPPWAPEALCATRAAWAALDLEGTAWPAKIPGLHPATWSALHKRMPVLVEGARESVGQPFAFLRAIEAASAPAGQKDLFALFGANLPSIAQAAPEIGHAIGLLLRHAISLSAALVHTLLPSLAELLEHRKRHTGNFDYQDLLVRVARDLDGPDGPDLIERLRARYRAAVIDEFQDTDAVQWDIFRRVFAESGGRNMLYLIGDPKQAIYDFRGANVNTYLAARDALARAGNPIHTLTQSFRSTQALLNALNRLCVGRDNVPESGLFTVGAIRAVSIACGRPQLQLVDHMGRPLPPLHLFRVERATERSVTGALRAGAVRAALARHIAGEIAALLAHPPALLDGDQRQAIGAADIFVLARTGFECEAVADALAAHAIPHAVWREQDIMHSDEARWLRRLLAALIDPSDATRRFMALSSGLFGADLEMLLNEPQILSDSALHAAFLRLAELGRRRDYDALFSAILHESGVLRRSLALGGDPRVRANLLHVLESLRQDIGHTRPALATVVRMLDERMVMEREEDRPRLPTDRAAVQVMTIHKSKGLEAAIVFLFGGLFGFRGKTALCTYEDDHGTRRAYIGRARLPEIQRRIERQRTAEEQRLCYVALTRAKGCLYLPCFPRAAENTDAVDTEGENAAEVAGQKMLDGAYRHIDRVVREWLAEPASAASCTIRSVKISDPDRAMCADEVTTPTTAAASPAVLAADKDCWAPLPAVPSTELSRIALSHRGPATTSYSRLRHRRTADAADIASWAAALLDETNLAGPVPAAGWATPTARGLPGGAEIGIFLHEILEHLPLESVSACPLPEDWHRRRPAARVFEAALRRHGLAEEVREEAARLVACALTRPLPLSADGSLGPLPGLVSLSDAEGTVLRETPFLYPDSTRARDFVTGVLDVVFRLSCNEERVFLLDWKSDVLPPGLSPAAHVAEHYGVQIRLYATALVRTLGIRDERDHADRFGGMLYVFLREPGPTGVVFLRPDWLTLARWLDAR